MTRGLLIGLILVALTGVANATVIDFDDVRAPNTFAQQTRLADEYSALGVHFSGPGEVLNFNSGFGVDTNFDLAINPTVPLTPPNFLAFNSFYFAARPENIDFDFNINSFSLDFAGAVGTISLTAVNNGEVVDRVFLSSVSSRNWSTINLSLSAAFNQVIFGFVSAANDNSFVVDNLNFTESSPVPEPATILLLGSGLVGLACVRRRKKQARGFDCDDRRQKNPGWNGLH